MPGLAVRDLVVIHRLEAPLPVTYLCYAAWGACFAAGDARRLVDPVACLAIAANLLLILGGLALNTAADVRTDERHHAKGYLAQAVRGFGRGRTVLLAAAESAGGLALAAVVSASTGRWAVLTAATATVLLQLLYNVEPARLKRRGLAGPLVFGAAIIGTPFLLSYWAVRPGVDPPVWPVLAGLTVLAIGRTAWWSLPDREADRATGIGTPPVRHGTAGAHTRSCLILAAGLALLGWGLWWRYGPAWVLPGTLAHLAFLAGVLATRRHAPDASRMRRHGMPVVMAGDLMLAVLPLAA